MSNCVLMRKLFFTLQYFVFDFHVPPHVMFDKIIKLSVSNLYHNVSTLECV